MRMLRLPRCLLAVPLAAAGVLHAAASNADDGGAVTVHDLDPRTGAAPEPTKLVVDYLDLGPILSLVGGFHHATGIGLEGSWIRYPTGTIPSFGYGAFVQAQLYDEKYFRTAAGAQFTAGPAGVELGLAVRQGDGTYATTVAVHAAGFLSIGYFLMAFRISEPFLTFPTNQASFGLETAVTLGLKLPLTINGRDPTGYAIQLGGHAW
jgi:hypothetical protein